MTHQHPLFAIAAWLLCFCLDISAQQHSARELLILAQQKATRGNPNSLIQEFLQPALITAKSQNDDALVTEVSIMMASQYRLLGRNHDALRLVQDINPLTCTGRVCQVALKRETALAQAGNGNTQQAFAFLRQAFEQASTISRRDLQASIRNDMGVLAADLGEFARAASYLDESLKLDPLQLGTRLNRTRIALEQNDRERLIDDLGSLAKEINLIKENDTEANYRLRLGVLFQQAQKRYSLPVEYRLKAYEQFSQALEICKNSGQKRLQSFALGYLGGLYEDEQRSDEALQYSRRAAFLAQSINADDALYRWQWQIARILRAKGEEQLAIIAYRQSIETLGHLKSDLNVGASHNFRKLAAPVFFDFADTLLRRTAAMTDDTEIENNLREVRTTLEQVKLAEVQEYFGDQCMQAETDRVDLDDMTSTAAIIYPVLLADRTELLVSLPEGLQQFTSPVTARQLTAEIRDFRREIERYDGKSTYLRHARRLYQWLIQPLEHALESSGVETLVIVPDGPLRTIPLSALHDGERFLIERFALATTPGLTLTDPRPLERDSVEVFAGGLTKAVQGFSALPNVSLELDSLSEKFPSHTIRNEAFVINEIESQISQGDQAIVHIATHGQFNSDHTKSFLLAYDDKFTMDRLQSTIASRKFQGEPLELLVLSACQTAAGDDRAALGLAGVALKAGARSALATLWFVNDESTSRLVADFYQNLGLNGLSKASALQKAQVALINNPRFSHPSYWAPFLLIGNWL